MTGKKDHFYRLWAKEFKKFCNKNQGSNIENGDINRFISHLSKIIIDGKPLRLRVHLKSISIITTGKATHPMKKQRYKEQCEVATNEMAKNGTFYSSIL